MDRFLKIVGPPKKVSKQNCICVLKSIIPFSLRRNFHNRFAENTKRRFLKTDIGLFEIIHIETRTLCNGTCAFCPAAIQYHSRKDVHMNAETFRKIIEELSGLKYGGRISLYCNNEPLVDSRIYDFLRLAREKCPYAFLEIKTNGKLLDSAKLQTLVACGLDSLNISDYSTTPSFSTHIQELIDYLKKDKLSGATCRICIEYRKEQEVLQNRAGTSPTKAKLRHALPRFCSRPFEMITVGTEGQIGLCSSDFDFSHTIGDIHHMSLVSAWKSDALEKIRRSMLHNDRSCTRPCSVCDYHGYYTEDIKGFKRLFRWI